jgi:hypothetical protein
MTSKDIPKARRQAIENGNREIAHFEKALFDLRQHLDNEAIRQSLIESGNDPEKLRTWINGSLSPDNSRKLRHLV